MSNKNLKSIALIGGDLRQVSAKDHLCELGYTCSAYGIDTYIESVSENELKNAQIYLLPVPVMRGEYINMPFSDVKMTIEDFVKNVAGENRICVGGLIPCQMKDELIKKGCTVFDLCENERYAYLNAVPTAEGAIGIAISHTKTTLNESSCAIIGYGRIGRCLTRRLKGFNADISVFARKEKDRSEAEAEGYDAYDIRNINDVISSFDVIFNTVPSVIVNGDGVKNIKKDAVVIELASDKGGFDTESALKYGVNIITARSLPGRTAPVSAGKIIAKCLDSFLKTEEQV